jgi:hypothetical protein
VHNPARASTPPQEQCAKLSANITQKDDVWQAYTGVFSLTRAK